MTPSLSNQTPRRLPAPLIPVITLLILAGVALALGALAVTLTGKSPTLALQELINGAVGTRTSLAATVTRSIPIVLSGLATAIAFKAGQFNLGLEGQMVMGALASAVTANALRDLPPLLLLPITLLVGSVAGGIWAFFPAWWQTALQVPVVISTLLLNYIAVLFASYLVNFPLRDVSGSGGVAQTVMIPETIRFGLVLTGTRLHSGVLFAVVLPLVIWWFYRRTALGYQVRMTGLNANFAAYGGIPVVRMVQLALVASGAVAGLAGAIQVLGVDFRYIDNVLVSAGFAWTGFMAAILAQSNPLVIVVTGLFLGGLEVGAAGMQRVTQIPLQIADVVQAVIIFMAAIRGRVGHWLRRETGDA